MPRIKQPDENCACLHGTPVIGANGSCTCVSTVNSIPPMPTTPLPPNFKWQWNGTAWVRVHITTLPVGNGLPASVGNIGTQAQNFIRTNPLMALLIGAGALYLLTKKK